LEPWITPSLFYRFLGKTASEGVGMDAYTFCEALGPEEGNAVMRAHWDAWLDTTHIDNLAERGVEVVRIPIGDWTLTPYGPYVGCMDGAAEKIEWAMDEFHARGIKVLLDVHAVKDSQNGFDNSGQAMGLEWTDETHFRHWTIQNASWMGTYNGKIYETINLDNIEWALQNVRNLMAKWGNHPALYALEPVNEPWEHSDLPTLKQFYRDCRAAIREVNDEVIFVFHDAFISSHWVWNDLFEDDDIENTVMDTHKYMAWNDPMDTIGEYCSFYENLIGGNLLQKVKYPIWVGEWSLATDTCALWLGGFNDSNTPYQVECRLVSCPETYVPAPEGTDFDRTADVLGPFGEFKTRDGQDAINTAIRNGMCQTDSQYFAESDVQKLGDCTREIFDTYVEGQFLWNFRTELEHKWSYVAAYDKGWLNPNVTGQQVFLN